MRGLLPVSSPEVYGHLRFSFFCGTLIACFSFSFWAGMSEAYLSPPPFKHLGRNKLYTIYQINVNMLSRKGRNIYKKPFLFCKNITVYTRYFRFSLLFCQYLKKPCPRAVVCFVATIIMCRAVLRIFYALPEGKKVFFFPKVKSLYLFP